MSDKQDEKLGAEVRDIVSDKPVDFAGISLQNKQALIMQYLFGALDNWRDDIGLHKTKDYRTECEDELCKAVDQLREMVGQVHGRKTIL